MLAENYKHYPSLGQHLRKIFSPVRDLRRCLQKISSVIRGSDKASTTFLALSEVIITISIFPIYYIEAANIVY